MAGSEAEHLGGALERLRATFRWKADGLDAAGLTARLGTSSLTRGGLLKHLAAVEDRMFTTKLAGAPVGEPWDESGSDGEEDWELTSAAAGPEQLVHASAPDGRHPSLRRLLCDLIEEYGRHTGHADLLREAVDGRVGEDPPADWRTRTFRG